MKTRDIHVGAVGEKEAKVGKYGWMKKKKKKEKNEAKLRFNTS